MKTFQKQLMRVKIYESRDEMGKRAAADVAACIHRLLAQKEEINMIFAAAPSQNEVLHYLKEDRSIPWERIHAFHMDEYVGLAQSAPQRFSNFLRNAIFDHVPFASVNLIDCAADAEKEAQRYAKLLDEHPVDIVCMGIGENGHIAFNDPHVADFNDPKLVKIVDLDEVCRMQQVHDGCFESLSDVPKYALTLTVPALARAAYRFCVVPAKTKAQAVKTTVTGEIGEGCPATVLRERAGSTLYCDADSASLLCKEDMQNTYPFALGFITDEVSQHLGTVAEFAKRYGARALELRSVNGQGPFEFTPETVEEIKRVCAENDLHVAAFSAPLFKCRIDDEQTVQKHIAAFERLAALAQELGTGLIRGFDFWESGASLQARVEAYRPIIEICRKYGVKCVVEYDPSVHSNTPQKLAELVAAIGDPAVGAVYDPGNGLFVDHVQKPFPQGYEALKKHFCHLHVKDAVPEGQKARAVKIGTGAVDYPALFERLLADGYTGFVMLETHYRKKAELSEEQLQMPGGKDFSDGAYEASSESMEALKAMIDRAIEG